MGIICEEETGVSRANLSAFVLPFVTTWLGTQQKLYYSGDYTFYTNLSQHDNSILTMQKKNIWYLNNLKTAEFC